MDILFSMNFWEKTYLYHDLSSRRIWRWWVKNLFVSRPFIKMYVTLMSEKLICITAFYQDVCDVDEWKTYLFHGLLLRCMWRWWVKNLFVSRRSIKMYVTLMSEKLICFTAFNQDVCDVDEWKTYLFHGLLLKCMWLWWVKNLFVSRPSIKMYVTLMSEKLICFTAFYHDVCDVDEWKTYLFHGLLLRCMWR